MPTHDHVPANSPAIRARIAREKAETARLAAAIERRLRKRRGKRGESGGEAVPVEPNRPLDLSGGAAAALEFDD